MYVSPTSASDGGTPRDALDELWSLSGIAREGRARPGMPEDVALQGLSGLEAMAAACVVSHLSAYIALTQRCGADAIRHADIVAERWDALRAAEEIEKPGLTPRSHAFHMRLASKHAAFYHDVERKALLAWPDAARLKSRYLRALALESIGNVDEALNETVAISDEWRRTTPIRLPGLRAVEATASRMAKSKGDGVLAAQMAARSQSFSGVNTPYPVDDPNIWGRPRQTEGILRFAFAATPIEPISFTAQSN